MPKRLTCELFFDVVSPYTHFALHVWSRYAQIWPVDLKLRPMLLGGVMKATGNSPPGTLPQRAAYLQQDLRRNASLFAVDILPVPNNFISEVARAVVHVQRVEAQFGVDADELSKACADGENVGGALE